MSIGTGLVLRRGDNCNFCGEEFLPPHVSVKRHSHERSCPENPHRTRNSSGVRLG